MRSVNDFEVEDLKQFLYRKRDGTGFVIFGSILRSERISEVKVLKLILCNRGLSTSFQLFLLSSLIQSQASISDILVGALYQQQQTGNAARWMKPSQGRYKCNVDASFSSRLNRVGIGMCIRDDQGRFVIAKTVWKSPIINVDLGEAIRLLSAIKWVHKLQLHNVGFELDSKNVVAKFHGHGEDRSELGDVIKDCQRLHASFFFQTLVLSLFGDKLMRLLIR
ncbi:hypothetical protein QL285_004006 [Trifolium repens]|nr:hypothetical protein QL285_004006 [Trifolium repens]